MRVINLILILGVFVFLINLVSADFSLGNKSYEITTAYNPGQNIKGWVNISFDNEFGSSLLAAFDSETSLDDFLDANNIDCSVSSLCSCFPADCKGAYSADGSGSSSKSFSLSPSSSLVLGIKLTGDIDSVDKINFKVSSDVSESCLSPLKIDLLEDGADWSEPKILNVECSADNDYGCYEEPSSGISSVSSSTKYCEKIELKGKGFNIGADLTGSGSAEFVMSVDAEDYEECEIDVNGNGEYSCNVTFENEIENEIQADICIIADSANTNEYTIKYEDENPCGYSGGFEHDFKIFAKPLKFAAIENFEFNQTSIFSNVNLGDEIESYILEKYDRNCSEGCIIPIKFSGINQNIVVSNLDVDYLSDGLSRSESLFYDISSSDFKISSKFLKLDLEKSGIKVPSLSGKVFKVM